MKSFDLCDNDLEEKSQMWINNGSDEIEKTSSVTQKMHNLVIIILNLSSFPWLSLENSQLDWHSS